MMQDGEDELEERRKQLASALGQRRGQKTDEGSDKPEKVNDRREMSRGLKLSNEFISAIFVGFMLGYILDRFAGTSPWGMIVCLLLGFGAGILNILRSVGLVVEPEDRIKRDKK
ncbi:AtpZ/AtpI family protein [Martelella mediterranea]|uniref:ATP synthase protein I n=1 Tax=Martelella mediterranea TaxID=293089 RepID=A0A4R3NXS1_9HYPH|nr:AtpZ/AtpI family protein [Martelella mediterranea]TCT44560.1 ATP synthase protein I [Martelella mediterranea]